MPLTLPQLRQWLLATLARLAPDYEGEITDDTRLTDDGLCLDSLTLVDLIRNIEDELDVQIREDEISPEAFETSGRLLAFLARELASRAEHSPGPLGIRDGHNS